jgi:hypothetical protein
VVVQQQEAEMGQHGEVAAAGPTDATATFGDRVMETVASI